MSEAPESNIPSGTTVGSYRVEYRLGAGGVGTVYAAEDPLIKKRVAIKVLNRGFAEDASFAARFEREARAANEINHPGIVDVLSLGKLPDGRPYLVMSLLEGRSLRDELAARGALPAAEAWRIAREVAEALGAAHAIGVVHRDMKPDNVFLEKFGARPAQPRVLDFGIAKVDTEGGDSPMKLTQTGVPIGTPTYMAPEQWWCQPITPQTDQYAFGGMLFEMLTGRPPFASQQFVELVQLHLHTAPPTLADAGLPADPKIEALVARTLAKAPDARFSSMAELIEAGDRAFADAGEMKAPEVMRPALKANTSKETPVAVATSSASTDLATAPTVAVSSTPAFVTLSPALPRAFRRYLAVHAALLGAGTAGLIALGYAGPQSHSVPTWIAIGGFGQFPNLGLFLVSAVALPILARRRSRTGLATRSAFVMALLPGLSGALVTYTNWHAILAGMATFGETNRFTRFNEGMFEANVARFMGFAMSSALLLSVATIPGISGRANPTMTLASAVGIGRREALAGAAGLLAVAVFATALGAPAGALVAGTAAAVLGASALFPTVNAETAARDEIERAVAGLMATGLAIAVAFTRIEAREAVLWMEQPTRAARVAEIIAAEAERSATSIIALIALAVVVLLEVLRVRRLSQRRGLARPSTRTVVMMIALMAAVAGDVAQHGRFLRKRDELRAEIASQFSYFSRLDPPPGDDLDPEAFPPHRSTALHVTRDAVAVNAKAVAKLAALESKEGAAFVAQDLNRAIAQAAVEQEGAAEVDLSIFVDREVPFAALVKLLSIARASGAARVDVMLARGATPPRSTAPESLIVVPGDFVALPVRLADEGFTAPAQARFGEATPALVALAKTGNLPVALAVPAR